MKSVLSAKRIKGAEQYTIDEIGIDAQILMERAAVEVAFSIMGKFNRTENIILVVCGAGNNGADGLAVSRILYENNYKVYICTKESKTELHKKQLDILNNMLSSREKCSEGSIDFCQIGDWGTKKYDVIVDALYGIGINRPVSDEDMDIINKINDSDAYVYAIDVPSGLDSTGGAVYNACVNADETICLGALKKGLMINKGPDYAGSIMLKNIGLVYSHDNDDYLMLEEADIRNLKLIKRITANKGTYGKALIIAGSEKIYGAAFLASKASITCGAGMIKICTHEANKYSLEHDMPEAMLSFYKDGEIPYSYDDDISWSTSILIGPGIGTGDDAARLVDKLLNSPLLKSKILIIDADAINIIASDKKYFISLTEAINNNCVKCVITPHKRELSRLMNLFECKYSEEDFCKMLFTDYSIVVIDKDANSRIFGEGTYINSTGNEGMATAGAGDVLAGMLGGLIYRIEDDFTKACAAVTWLHGKCGDEYIKKGNPITLTSTELVNNIDRVLDFLT